MRWCAQSVPYWDIQMLWPLFSWDLYSAPPHAECYKVMGEPETEEGDGEGSSASRRRRRWCLDPVVVTACCIETDTLLQVRQITETIDLESTLSTEYSLDLHIFIARGPAAHKLASMPESSKSPKSPQYDHPCMRWFLNFVFLLDPDLK